MRPNLPLALTLVGFAVPPLLVACNDGRGRQSFGPGSTGATTTSGSTPGPGGNLGSFAATGQMSEGRFRHTATALRDGRVLVVGGAGSAPTFPISGTAEVWDPATNMWQRTDAIATPNSTNGFLLIGGLVGQQSTRVDHAAVLLPSAANPNNSPVLIIGGFGQEQFGAGAPTGEALRSVFLFDPATNSFAEQMSMTQNRRGPLATVLPNGNVLVTGGQDNTMQAAIPQVRPATIGNTIQSSEIWDPATNTWTALANGNTAGMHGYGMLFSTGNQTIIAVNGASIQITGNVGFFIGAGASPRAEVYNVQGMSWTGGNPMQGDRFFFGGSLDTSSGTRVFVCGGLDPNVGNLPLLGTVEIFNSTSGMWTNGPTLTTPRAIHSVSEIGGGAAAGTGDMLIIGGRSTPPTQPAVQTAQCEIYGVLTNSILGTINMASAREDHRSVRMPDGRILVTGGFLGNSTSGMALPACEIYTR